MWKGRRKPTPEERFDELWEESKAQRLNEQRRWQIPIDISRIQDNVYQSFVKRLVQDGYVLSRVNPDAPQTEADKILNEIHAEFLRASSKFPPMNSAHEGYAILLEEVDELWEAVKKNDTVNMREEAVQVGAMALRFIVNVLDKKEGSK